MFEAQKITEHCTCSRERVSGYVLGDFSRAEQSELGPGLERACEAVEMILEKGVTPAMNEYNRERKPATKVPGP